MRRPSIRPVVWRPPPASPRARARSGAEPLPPLRLIEVGGTGPEDVVVDHDGWVVTGVADGRLLRIDPRTGLVEPLGSTGGRPLGVELLPDGRLLVCDARRGLLAVAPSTGTVPSSSPIPPAASASTTGVLTCWSPPAPAGCCGASPAGRSTS